MTTVLFLTENLIIKVQLTTYKFFQNKNRIQNYKNTNILAMNPTKGDRT